VRLDFSEAHDYWRYDGGFCYPIIDANIIARGGRNARTYAIVDTGADETIFHAKWLEPLGLRLKDGDYDTIKGIKEGGPPVEFYRHNVTLVLGEKMRIRCPVGFSEDIGEDYTDNLIGRKFVFDRLRFAFRQRIDKLYVARET
jgi:hypothetical protein